MDTVPPQIKNLPALVIDNGTKLIEGKDVFDYFQKREIESVDFSSKNFGSSFGNFEENPISNTFFAAVDEDDMSKGVPEYNEEVQKTIDLEKLQKERSNI